MKEIIIKFYQSMGDKNAERMASCYHPEIHFRDPAFGDLHGVHAGNMWRMLMTSQKDKEFKVEFKDIRTEGIYGYATCEARYFYGKKGRRVHNILKAEFEFKDGLIIRHFDQFNLHKWATMALGFTGWSIGWTSYFRKKLNNRTKSTLKKWEEKNVVG